MSEKLVAGATTKNGLVAESDLSYEAPDNTPTWDLKNAENDFISKLLAEEAGGEEPAPETADEPQDETYVEEEPVSEAPPQDEPEVQEEVEEPEVEDPKLARGIQRVVQREMAAKAEREAADRSIAELKALKAEMAQYKDLKSSKDLADMMDLDPIGAFKAMGKDPEVIIKLALAQQLGDTAPQALKDFARESSTKREIAQLKAQLAVQAQAQRAQEYFNTIQAGAREYVMSFEKTPKVGDSTPTLAKVAKADPDYVRDEIMEVIVADARAKAAQDPDGEPMAYAEAAKRVEERLARVAKLLSVQNGMTPANKNVIKPKNTPPSTKPAAKPLAPWQRQTSNLEEDGIREALRAFEQSEAQRKAARR